jgi:hypothetical protein
MGENLKWQVKFGILAMCILTYFPELKVKDCKQIITYQEQFTAIRNDTLFSGIKTNCRYND